jgi:DNA-damage-inducible protein D
MEHQLTPFEGEKIRKIWHDEEWYFSVIDIIEQLTDATQPNRYWADMKKRSAKENDQPFAFCEQLKMVSKDGRQRLTDCANTEGVLRIVMSVPSPKAEPFKQWLAGLGAQDLAETADPELGFERLQELYKAKGYSDEWISRRLKSIEIRKELTDEWKNRGVKEGQEYAVLTAEIAKATFGVSPSEHSKLKGLERQNLRDHMTNLELVFTMLGEEATRSMAVNDDAQGFPENHQIAQRGGGVAGRARQDFERTSGQKVISPKNYLENPENPPELPEGDAEK